MPRPPRPSLVYFLVGALSWPVFITVFRLRARGRENVPQEGGFVLAANHWSNFDPWPLGLPLFPGRFLRFMAKSELFWFPLGLVISAGGGFRVRRGERDEEAVATAVRLCREGHAVVMFPEGTRRRKGLRKKHQARWHSGAARIALEAGVPLVPAAISGTDRLARLGPLRVAYGAPTPLDDLSEGSLGERARVATERLRESIDALERSLT
jgi:1-acyl-sn-glycerol-3-phosphate acyltransferase